MIGARTRLFHAVVALGITSGLACAGSVEQAGTGTTGGTGGAGGHAGTGNVGSSSSTGNVGSSSGGGGPIFTVDGSISDAQQTWDVIPIK
jgi:hypothetical protein